MSNALINHSEDLRRLRDEGYEVEVRGGFLLVRGVPYVNGQQQVLTGTLVSELTLAGDVTTAPGTHVINFIGEFPCDIHGTEIQALKHSSGPQQLMDGLIVQHSFSNKPENGYINYYEKITSYIDVISAPAEILDPSLTARTFRVIECQSDESVFRYLDTNSSRAEIIPISDKLNRERVGIIGLGGTGSYVLDLVSKCPVSEIHLFDGDDFLQHNAFRAPGAAAIEDLRSRPKKVDFLKQKYSEMHTKIFAHPAFLDSTNAEEMLNGLTFVFICMDRGVAKKAIIEVLEKHGIPFIDVGIGVEIVDDKLSVSLRVTTSTPTMRDHVRQNRLISFVDDDGKADYDKNIQIAELNAVNAGLAVIKWKKLLGCYVDLASEHDTTYSLDDNALINEDHEA